MAGHDSDQVCVLIVDDEGLICHLADRILRKLGFSTLIAYDGEQALEVSRSHRGTIHLLLSDVKMPRLSGPELCQQIKLNRPGISCLLMSGNMSGIRLPEDVPFISKPFAPDFFRLKVQELLAAVKLESPNLHEFTSTGLQ